MSVCETTSGAFNTQNLLGIGRRIAPGALIGILDGNFLRLVGATDIGVGTLSRGTRFPLHLIGGPEPNESIQSLLGGGYFHFQYEPPVQGAQEVASLIPGSRYRVYYINQERHPESRNVVVWIRGMRILSEGILVCSGPVRRLSEEFVTARPPRDITSLAGRIIRIMDAGGLPSGAAPRVTIINIMPHLHRTQPNHDETMELFRELVRRGRIADFINLAIYSSESELLHWMQQQGVPWSEIFQYWEPSASNSLAFFGGVMAGASVDQVVGVAEIAPNLIPGFLDRYFPELLDEEFQQNRRRFWTAVRELLHRVFTSPFATGVDAVRNWLNLMSNELYNLRFFEAGRMFGNALVIILSIPGAARSIGRGLRFAAAETGRVTQAALQMLRRWGVTVQELFERLPRPGMEYAFQSGARIRRGRNGFENVLNNERLTNHELGLEPDVHAGSAGRGTSRAVEGPASSLPARTRDAIHRAVNDMVQTGGGVGTAEQLAQARSNLHGILRRRSIPRASGERVIQKIESAVRRGVSPEILQNVLTETLGFRQRYRRILSQNGDTFEALFHLIQQRRISPGHVGSLGELETIERLLQNPRNIRRIDLVPDGRPAIGSQGRTPDVVIHYNRPPHHLPSGQRMERLEIRTLKLRSARSNLQNRLRENIIEKATELSQLTSELRISNYPVPPGGTITLNVPTNISLQNLIEAADSVINQLKEPFLLQHRSVWRIQIQAGDNVINYIRGSESRGRGVNFFYRERH